MHIIGITGCSGSGKSSFCEKLKETLIQKNFTVCFITSDWFYKTMPHENCNYDTPLAFDFQPLITAINNRKLTKLPSYDYVHHCSIPDVNVYDPNVDFVIIEGIMIYNDLELRELFNTRIFIQTDLDACLARRLLRDKVQRGRTPEGVIEQWFATVKQGYESFIEPSSKYAHYIFNNTKMCIDENIKQDDRLEQLLLKLTKH